ncbi:MAG TPA: hypothetical protein PLV25_01970 [Opitutales bacterium]|nr:hypothetical protein [Opitutales bacterium]
MPQIDQAIIELISTQKIGEQDILCQRLNAQGHKVTQSTLSRRLKKLGVSKHQGFYRQISDFSAAKSAPQSMRFLLAPPNMIVVRTPPGQANGFAAKLDEAVELIAALHANEEPKLPESFRQILGTVAGDDTLFIVNQPQADQHALRADLEHFSELLGFGPVLKPLAL